MSLDGPAQHLALCPSDVVYKLEDVQVCYTGFAWHLYLELSFWGEKSRVMNGYKTQRWDAPELMSEDRTVLHLVRSLCH